MVGRSERRRRWNGRRVLYLDRQMNNQATMGRGARGGGGRGGGAAAGGGKNPSRPPRFSKNNATQSQVIDQMLTFPSFEMSLLGQFKSYTRWNNQSTISHLSKRFNVSTCLRSIATRLFPIGRTDLFSPLFILLSLPSGCL